MVNGDMSNPSDPAFESLAKIRESFDAFLKESSLRIKDLEQGTKLVEEVFKGATSNITQRQDQVKQQEQEKEQLKNDIKSTDNNIRDLENYNAEMIRIVDKLSVTVEGQKESSTQEKNRVGELEGSIKNKQEEVVSLESDITDLKEEINSIKLQGDKTLADILDEISTLDGAIKQLRKENAVLDFLIEESSVEIPEVDILTAVISAESSVSIDSIKRDLGVAPVTVNRTIQKLEAKGIITFSTVDSSINLIK
ncbi:MAG: hypothetical protein ACXAEU_10465 [Candidatus Hodarchaeales archaeon]|jgi:chromosome segregation ATPase